MDDPTTDPAIDPMVDDKTLAPIAALFNTVLAKREKAFLDGVESQIAVLADTPDRTVAESISDDGPVGADRGNASIVSRNQPIDPLYRQLVTQSPHYAEARTPDLDHWNAVWLRGLAFNDQLAMRTAKAKSDEILVRGGHRATTLGGVLDASDPTAISDGTGGHLLPQAFANVVEIARQAAAVIAPMCSNFTTPGLTLRVPTAGAVTAAATSESSSITQAEPTFASVMMILTKIAARMVASDEMVADSAFNLVSVYGVRAGEGIGLQEDTQICTSDGVSPNITGALAGGNVAEASSTELIYEDLNTLFFALGKAYQPNSTFLAGTVVCTLLSNMMDGNDHPVLKIPSNAPTPVTDSTPQAIGTVLGRPIYHVPLADGTLILGDLRGYGVVRKGGIVAKTSTDVGFATDTVQFSFSERIDGQILDAVAMKQMAGLATVA